MWLIILSDQLPIAALVGHYPANQLIGRRLVHRRPKAFFSRTYAVLALVSQGYSPAMGRSSTCSSPVRHSVVSHLVRLACVMHAASVCPEPGSNSPSNIKCCLKQLIVQTCTS